jgi:hypothetical protein
VHGGFLLSAGVRIAVVSKISQALNILLEHGLAQFQREKTGGRPFHGHRMVVRADDMMLTVEVAEPESPGSPRSEKG